VIRVDAVWLAVEPLDMRAGTEAALARVVNVFGAARPHHGVVVLFVQIGALWLEAQYPCGFTAVATPGR